MKKAVYSENGVVLSKGALKVGEEIEIQYTGLLKTSGAGEVRIHLGYNDSWENASTVDMTNAGDAFLARLSLIQSGALNFAFVDPAGNWDNNSGSNYTFEVKSAAGRKAKSEETRSETKTGTKSTRKASKKDEEPETQADAPKSKRGRKPSKAASEQTAPKAKSKKVEKAEQEAAVTVETKAKAKKASKESDAPAKKKAEKASKE
ncbi:MAG: carbohydrate-binding protein [Clostridia bacterium]|nr:carbohydrate-binding protein [Clostridia bacterium]